MSTSMWLVVIVAAVAKARRSQRVSKEGTKMTDGQQKQEKKRLKNHNRRQTERKD